MPLLFAEKTDKHPTKTDPPCQVMTWVGTVRGMMNGVEVVVRAHRAEGEICVCRAKPGAGELACPYCNGCGVVEGIWAEDQEGWYSVNEATLHQFLGEKHSPELGRMLVLTEHRAEYEADPDGYVRRSIEAVETIPKVAINAREVKGRIVAERVVLDFENHSIPVPDAA